VHQQQITRCPPELVKGHYSYGTNKHSKGKVPQWIERLIREENKSYHTRFQSQMIMRRQSVLKKYWKILY